MNHSSIPKTTLHALASPGAALRRAGPAGLGRAIALFVALMFVLAACQTAPTNAVPTAQDDAYTTQANTTLNVAAPGVLDNDSDADSDPLTASVVSDVSNGTLALNADGSFTYEPATDFDGTDSFEYQVADGNGGTDTATVTITVTASNTAPSAVDDTYTTDMDITLDVAAPGVLANDSDADGDPLTVSVMTDVSSGTLGSNADGSFSYTPNAGFSGTDSFEYQIADGNGGTATATVTITVTDVNTAPKAVDDAYETEMDTTLNVMAPGLLSNDSDKNGDPLAVSLVTDATNGTLTLNADGSFSYEPSAGFTGTDSFEYEIDDGNGGTDTATVIIGVGLANTAPSAQDDSYTTDENVTLTVTAANGVLSNDSDADGDPLTVSLVTDASHGALTLNADGSFTYDPNVSFSGTDSFGYQIADGKGGVDSATATITVTAVNTAPIAEDDAYSTAADTNLNVSAPGVLSNDSDADGDTLTVSLATDVSSGTLTLNADGSFTYEPNAGFSGADTFGYQIDDGNGGTDTATVTITVDDANAAPVISGTPMFTGYGNTNLSVTSTTQADNLLAGASDPDGDTLSTVAETVTTSGGGSVDINANGTFAYTPAPGATGTITFDYQVTDGDLATTGTAELSLAGLIWYVDNTAAPGGSGISSAPFETMSDGVTAAASGNIVYVATGSGSYGAGVTLKDGISLIGEGVALMVGTDMVEPAGTAPTLDADASGAAAAVTVGNGNTVSGFSFDGSGANNVHGVRAENLASPQTNLVLSSNTFSGYSYSDFERPVQLEEVDGLTFESNTFTTIPEDGTDGRVVNLSNVTGAVDILTNTFTGEIGATLMYITVDDTAPLMLNVDGNDFAPTTHPGNEDGVYIFVDNLDDVTASITNNTFANIGFETLRFNMGGTGGAATVDATVTGNSFDTANLGVVLSSDQDHVLRALVDNNTFVDSRGTSIITEIGATATGNTVLDATILSNTFTNVGTPRFADAISAELLNPAATGQQLRVLVANNVVNGVAAAGFAATSEGADASNVMSVTLRDNDFLLTNGNFGNDSVVLSAASASGLCIDADGNEATYDTGLEGSYLVEQTGTSTVRAEEAPDAPAFAGLQLTGTATYTGMVTDPGAGVCAEPTLPATF